MLASLTHRWRLPDSQSSAPPPQCFPNTRHCSQTLPTIFSINYSYLIWQQLNTITRVSSHVIQQQKYHSMPSAFFNRKKNKYSIYFSGHLPLTRSVLTDSDHFHKKKKVLVLGSWDKKTNHFFTLSSAEMFSLL